MTHADVAKIADVPTTWPSARVPRSISALKRMFVKYFIYRRNCKELRELSEDQLFDVGLSREDIESACEQRFFRS